MSTVKPAKRLSLDARAVAQGMTVAQRRAPQFSAKDIALFQKEHGKRAPKAEETKT